MYVTLEPCAHQGRQPPCVEAILEAGIGRVVIASEDPSEKAAGRGPGILRDGGVEVAFASGAEATAARRLNQPFRKHSRTGLPLVVLKMAMSLDGQTTTAPGDSPWISGPESRELVHQWRAESDAIAIGIGTALAEPPPNRPNRGSSPAQTRHLRLPSPPTPREPTPPDPRPSPRHCAHRPQRASRPRWSAPRTSAPRFSLPTDLESALRELGRREVTSLFLEGGQTLASAFLTSDLRSTNRGTLHRPSASRSSTSIRFLAWVATIARNSPGSVEGPRSETGPARQTAQWSSTPPGRRRHPDQSHVQGVVKCSPDSIQEVGVGRGASSWDRRRRETANRRVVRAVRWRLGDSNRRQWLPV